MLLTTKPPLHQPPLNPLNQLPHPLRRPRPENQTIPRIDEARLVKEGDEHRVDGETAEVRGEEEGFLGGGAGEAGVRVVGLELFLLFCWMGGRDSWEERDCWEEGGDTRCWDW